MGRSIVQYRARYIVGYGPRVKGSRPGSPTSSHAVPATSAGVYVRRSGMPEALRTSVARSGWRAVKAATSDASHAAVSASARRAASVATIGVTGRGSAGAEPSTCWLMSPSSPRARGRGRRSPAAP